jgi:phosphoribosylanthranilate isomerase
MPSGPGVIPEPLIAEIASTVPPPVGRFLLTSLTDPDEIVAQQQRCGANTLQLCDRIPTGAHAILRKRLPGISLIQVVHVVDEKSVAEALQVAPKIDALLLDSGDQSAAVKQLGGTGRVHDWSLSAEIVARSVVPVFLAGGLNAANVGWAIRAVGPFGVDVCTGVRTDGVLDERKLVQFMAAVTRQDADFCR